MPYIPHTQGDTSEMLDVIGVESIEQLFDEVPSHLRVEESDWEQLPHGQSEMRTSRVMADRSRQDECALNFIGAGAYEHFIPAAVWDVVSRGEILTAYTPYQAEASQGTLQIIYEFQTIIAEVMAMDVANASLYDGASGLAEAILMAVRANRKVKSRRVLVAGTLHQHYLAACQAICGPQNIVIESVPYDSASGAVLDGFEKAIGEEPVLAVVIPQPNFFGVLEDVTRITDWAHDQGALVIGVVNPVAMMRLVPPGQWGQQGADIAVGEAQPFGIPLSSGGPYCGFMACKMPLVRQMPGRIIGQTEDVNGDRGFALTLQAREQHIRRAKATSNICTNQGLAMTAATIHVGLMGSKGLERVADHCVANTQTLISKIAASGSIKPVYSGPVFHEVVLELPVDADAVVDTLAQHRIAAGLALGRYNDQHRNHLLVCVTETKSEQDLDTFVAALSSAIEELQSC